MHYPGKELKNFERAKNWRKYVFFCIRKYLKDEILEVGSGIGSFTTNYLKHFKNITLTEVDQHNFDFLKDRFRSYEKINVIKDFISSIDKNFNTIIHLNVLEHIQDDKAEINNCLKKIKKDGYLILLVPAHNELYSNFDKEVGHIRRYDKSFFKSLELIDAKIEKLIYLDSMGYFLYYLNKLFFNKTVYPSKFKIFIWDKIFSPLSMFVDFIIGYNFGKNILCIIKKTD